MKQAQPQITIVNSWHDDNKGDCGIVVGTIAALKHCYPQARFTLVSMFAEDSTFYSQGHRHLQQLFPNLSVVPSPCFSHDIAETPTIYQKAAKFLPIPRSLLFLGLSLGTRSPGLQALTAADLVISSGGQYLRSRENQYKSLYIFYRLFYPLLVAQKYQIPYLFFSQSFEFDDPQRLDSRLMKVMGNRAISVWARESLSKNALQEIGILPEKVKLVPDAGLFVTPHQSDRVISLLERHQLNSARFWAVTVKDCQFDTERLLSELTKAIEQLFAQNKIDRLVLISNSQGPTAVEDDRLVAEKLAQNLRGLPIVEIAEDLTPNELSAIYGRAEFLIGTRFQSLILALAAGTPVYGISYAGFKVLGLMELLAMPELCSSLAYFAADTILEQIEALDLATLSKQIDERVKLLRQQTIAAIDLLPID